MKLDPHGYPIRITSAVIFALVTIGLAVLAWFQPQLGLWCAGGVAVAFALYVGFVNWLER